MLPESFAWQLSATVGKEKGETFFAAMWARTPPGRHAEKKGKKRGEKSALQNQVPAFSFVSPNDASLLRGGKEKEKGGAPSRRVYFSPAPGQRDEKKKRRGEKREENTTIPSRPSLSSTVSDQCGGRGRRKKKGEDTAGKTLKAISLHSYVTGGGGKGGVQDEFHRGNWGWLSISRKKEREKNEGREEVPFIILPRRTAQHGVRVEEKRKEGKSRGRTGRSNLWDRSPTTRPSGSS